MPRVGGRKQSIIKGGTVPPKPSRDTASRLILDTGMNCSIYKSNLKLDTYLYVRRRDDFSGVPPALMKAFGQPVFVMELELTPERKLAQEDVNVVMRNLVEKGFHLQLPPGDFVKAD